MCIGLRVEIFKDGWRRSVFLDVDCPAGDNPACSGDTSVPYSSGDEAPQEALIRRLPLVRSEYVESSD